MQASWKRMALGVTLLAAVGGWPATGTAQDHDRLAQTLVNDVARVREGDYVLISGAPRDVELLEDVAAYVAKVGGFPLVTLSTERMGQLYFSKVPARYDSREPKLDLDLTRLFNVTISIDPSESLDAFAAVPPERRAAIGQAFAPVGTLALKRGVRGVSVGNDLYPTAARARQFGVSPEELARQFWSGVNVDYAKLQATARAGVAALAAKEIHITHPNGTDLRARIEGRPVFASDGVISAEDEKKGGAACQVYLPAGEVYLAPVPGTAEGKVVVDRQFFEGKAIEGLTLTYTGGGLVSMTANAGLEGLKALYDAAGTGKDRFGVIDIGINPSVRLVPGSRMTSWVPAGTVTLTLGNDTWAGGENAAPFGLPGHLAGATVKVDGRAVVEDGTLKF